MIVLEDITQDNLAHEHVVSFQHVKDCVFAGRAFPFCLLPVEADGCARRYDLTASRFLSLHLEGM